MKYLLNGEETNRLKFRLLQSDDFNEWLTLFNGTNVARFFRYGKCSNRERKMPEMV